MVKLAEAHQAFEVAVEAGEVPGVVAVAVGENGVRYEGAFGQCEFSKAARRTLDTVFWIASMSKAVAAVAAMQLVEQRQLTLDEPLGERRS